jgi:small-conductance mechanosensitive channel
MIPAYINNSVPDMDLLLQDILQYLILLLPTVAATTLVVLLVMLIRHFVAKQYAMRTGKRYQRQLIMLGVYLVALLAIIISLPISDTLRGQLLSLIGIIISATIALASSTFVGNAMAGVMLRTLRNFHVGDFLRVGEYFGRVTETGLLHVEIQTEDRDLMTIPNLYLVTNPTKVILSDGTIISAQISLGYDHAWGEIEPILLQAALDAGLEEPFVLIQELGDFSISYQINGLLSEVKQLISVRSTLRKCILDNLHTANIEIVSPTFMNTRAYEPNKHFIPKKVIIEEAVTPGLTPEDIVFDIAEEAESLEKLREKREDFARQMTELKGQIDRGDEDVERGAKRMTHLEDVYTRLGVVITRREQENASNNH